MSVNFLQDGSTPLMVASSGGHVETVKFLLSFGAKTSIKIPEVIITVVSTCQCLWYNYTCKNAVEVISSHGVLGFFLFFSGAEQPFTLQALVGMLKSWSCY